MSLIPLSGNEILVSTPDSAEGPIEAGAVKSQSPGTALVSWIMQRVQLWENVRERGYGRLWAQYWRLWRGKWDALDQNRQSERSRVITPALAQAIEASVAEIEEAVFAKESWFDIDESKTPQHEKLTALMQKDQLLEDMEKVNVKGAVSEAVLSGAIFGTGIIQISPCIKYDTKPQRDPATQQLKKSKQERVTVEAEAIRPDMFIPDPAATSIEEMLGCAVKRVKPWHSVLEKIKAGIYRSDALPYVFPQHRMLNRDIDKEVDPQSQITVVDADEMEIVEWHGKVPLGMLNAISRPRTQVDDLLNEDTSGDEMIEATVTIGNGSVLLRAMPNPNVMGDRNIIAFQYETVPGRFWGRGVAEKGYNPQIALDATVRAYIDALGFISAPMLGVDTGRIPKGFKNAVYPGKVWLTQGPPADVLSTVQIGQFQPAMFQQASEMERMVQMGTGAFDTASALNNQSQSGANSMSANSMLMGAFVKRAKRVIQNVDRHLLTPLVTKFMWRYMQFDAARYQTDFDFTIKATMGIVAREAENMQLTQLIGMLPEEYGQVKLLLAQGIIENSAITNKFQILQAVSSVLNPSPQQQQQAQHAQQMQLQIQQAEAESLLLKNQETIANIRKLTAQAEEIGHKSAVSIAELDQEAARLHQAYLEIVNQGKQVQIQAAQLPIDRMKAEAALISAHRKPTGSAGK